MLVIGDIGDNRNIGRIIACGLYPNLHHLNPMSPCDQRRLSAFVTPIKYPRLGGKAVLAAATMPNR